VIVNGGAETEGTVDYILCNSHIILCECCSSSIDMIVRVLSNVFIRAHCRSLHCSDNFGRLACMPVDVIHQSPLIALQMSAMH